MVNAQTSSATTNFDKTVQELINKRLEERLRAPKPHLNADQFVKATHVAGSNGTMRFLNVPDAVVDDTEVTASLVQVEGSPNDTDDLVIGYEEFATRQRMKTYKATDVAALKMPQIVAEGSKVLAEYVANLLDRIAAIKIATGTNVIYAGTGNAATADVADGDVLTGTIIKRAVALLEGGSVPKFGDETYRAIIHPYAKLDVQLDESVGGWLDANRYAGSRRLFSGEMGEFAGVRFVVSSNARVKAASGAGGIDVYSTTIFGPRFFALGDFGNNQTFVTPPGGHDDPGHQSALVTWKGWADAMVMGEGTNATNVTDPRYIRIESASSI